MSRYGYSRKHPIDDSNKKSVDPVSTKLPILENISNHKSEQHVDAPNLVYELKYTVQTKVEPPNPVDISTQFKLGQQRRTSLPILHPTGKLELGPNKNDQHLSPIRDDKINHPVKVEKAKDYRINNNTHDMSLTRVPDQKHTFPTEEINNKQESPLNPVHDQTYSLSTQNYGVVDKKQDKPSTLVRDHGYNKSPLIEGVETKTYLDNKRGKAIDPVHDGPKQVEEFISNIQSEVSQPARPGFLSGGNRRNIGGNQDLEKPNVEPYIVAKTGWKGPSNREWALPTTQSTPIFGPTNDIGKAVNALKELVTSAPPPRYNFDYTQSKNLVRDTNEGVIDSREAQRRYGNQNPSAIPSANYIGTISSTEAARKYGGKPV